MANNRLGSLVMLTKVPRSHLENNREGVNAVNLRGVFIVTHY